MNQQNRTGVVSVVVVLFVLSLALTGAVPALSESASAQSVSVATTSPEADEAVVDAKSNTDEAVVAAGTGVSTAGINATTRTRQESANFAVTIEETNAPIQTGGTLEVAATIQNTGDTEDTQEIYLVIDGGEYNEDPVDGTERRLEPGESQTVFFEWPTAEGDTGTYSAIVATADDQAAREVTVGETANFDVTIEETNSPIDEGDTLEVTATIQNTGTEADTKRVLLAIDGGEYSDEEVDGGELTLEPSESRTATFEWDTARGDAGDYVAKVITEDDRATREIGVGGEEPASFAVALDGTSSSVAEGETLRVGATIQNRGGITDTQQINLKIDDTRVDATELTLAPDESQTVRLGWQTSAGDAGGYVATVLSEDDSAAGEVGVNEPANFSTNIEVTNSPVQEGDALEVNAPIRNTGGTTATKQVGLRIGDTLVNSTSLTLASGDSQMVTLGWQTTTGDAGSYDAQVETTDDWAATGVTVEESATDPANFTANIEVTNSPVTEGDALEVNAPIRNTGGTTATRQVDLRIGDELVDSTNLTLAPNDEQIVTLTWQTTTGDAGSYDAQVETTDDWAATGVTVEQSASDPANFAANIEVTNSPVTEGELLTVNAPIRNTGGTTATRQVDLRIGNELVNSTSRTLAPDDSQMVTLGWQTTAGDAGSYDALVETQDDQASTGVTVEQSASDPANFVVNIETADSPVEEGDPLAVSAQIQNTGGTTANQQIDLRVGDELADSTDVTLSPQDTQLVTLTWQTAAGDAGSHTATVASQDDQASADVTLEQSASAADPANFAVRLDGTNSPVSAGERLEVMAAIQNTGGTADTQQLALRIGDEVVDSTEVTLSPGDSQTVALTWQTTGGDTGQYVTAVDSQDETDSTDVTVEASASEEPATFDVAIESVTSPVEAGNALAVNAQIQNTGGTADNQRVTLRIGDILVDSTDVSIAAGESTTKTLTWQTAPDDVGEYVTAVESENDSAVADIAVETSVSEKPAAFDVAIDETNSAVAAGESLTVTGSVENTGERTGSAEVTLSIGGETVDSRTITLDGGESTAVTFEWATESGEAGDYVATVESEDDSASTDIRVDQPATFVIEVESGSTAVPVGESPELTATVENVGDRRGSTDIEMRVENETVDAQSVTLDGGESTTVTLEWATEPGNAGEYTAAVETEDDTATSAVTIVAGASFAVTIESLSGPVTEGENMEVVGVVENVGGMETTQRVELVVDSEVIGARPIALGPGESTRATFTWETETGDAGSHAVALQTENTRVETGASVLAPAEFAVDIEKTTAPVVEGKQLNVTAAIENRGGQPGTQPIRLVTDTEQDQLEQSLAGGETTTVTLSWETTPGDAGEYTVAVESGSDRAETGVTIEERVDPADADGFAVNIESTNAPAQAGETVTVDANVTNDGTRERTEQLTLISNDTTRGSQMVTLAGGDSRTTTLTWETEDDDAGEYTITVAGEQDQATTDITVDGDAGEFVVQIEEVMPPEENDGEYEVNATIENAGASPDTQTVTLRTNEIERVKRNLSLSSGESKGVTFSWEQEDSEENLTIEVASETDRDTTTATTDRGGSDSALSTAQLAGIVLLVLLLAAGYYYLRRRQLSRRESSEDGDRPDSADEKQPDRAQ